MTLLGLPAAQLGALFAGGAAVLTVLYLLKQRRRRLQVPFLKLWEQVLRDSSATALQRRLRLWLSLLLQLLCLGLLLLAIGDPRLDQSRSGRNLVLLIDASASMQARAAGAADRLALARREAHRLISGLSGDDRAAVVVLSGEPAPLSGLTQDEAALHAQVDAIVARDEPADLPRSLRLCADLLAGRQGAQVVLLSDGGFDDATLALLDARDPAGPGVSLRYQPLPGLGPAQDNLAISAFSVRRYPRNRTSYEVLLEVTSFPAAGADAGPPREVQVELLQEGEVVELARLRLRPGERVQKLFANLAGSGEHLTARLRHAAPDALALDDTAYALLPERRRQRVLLVTAGNLFLEGALLSTSASDGGSLQVDKVIPAAYRAAAAAPYDALIFDGFTPPEPPPTHALYLDPQGPGSPFPIRETLSAPLVTDTAAAHPLLRWVTLTDLNVSRASVFQLERGDVAVAAMLQKPFIAARQRAVDGQQRRVVALGFDLRRSDLPLRVAFPVLLVNALDWFAGDSAEDTQSYATGRTWRIPTRDPAPTAGRGTLDLLLPGGRRAPVPVYEGRALYHGHQVGFYELLRPGGRPLLLCGNLADATESAARVRPQLLLGGAALPPPDPPRSAVRRVLWPYLLIAALLLLCLEWLSYHRRWTL